MIKIAIINNADYLVRLDYVRINRNNNPHSYAFKKYLVDKPVEEYSFNCVDGDNLYNRVINQIQKKTDIIEVEERSVLLKVCPDLNSSNMRSVYGRINTISIDGNMIPTSYTYNDYNNKSSFCNTDQEDLNLENASFAVIILSLFRFDKNGVTTVFEQYFINKNLLPEKKVEQVKCASGVTPFSDEAARVSLVILTALVVCLALYIKNL